MSVTLTAMLWLGMGLMVVGAITAIFGLAAATSFSGKWNGIDLNATNTGLAVFVVAALFSAYLATRLPRRAQIFSADITALDFIRARLAAVLLGLAAIGLVGLIVALRLHR